MSIYSIARWFWYASGLRAAKLWVKYNVTNAEWKRLQRSGNTRSWAAQTGASPTALIIPPDPLLLIASKGDEAMITCVISAIRQDNENARIVIATCGEGADAKARQMGLEPCRILDEGSLSRSAERMSSVSPTHVFTIGADVLDGSYDPDFSLRLLALTDLAARKGAVCSVTGFSFSKKPYRALAKAYSSASRSIVFRLRDRRSFERFREFCSARAELVADVAFLLKPDPHSARTNDLRSWITERRAEGQKVIGLNFHPLLLPPVRRGELPSFVASLADSISSLIANANCSVVLLAHDFRGTSADHHCLGPLYDSLQRSVPGRVFNADEEFSASELKGLVGALDGVISGRMHLAIASLGMGTPVFAFSYKDKMEGLLMHFALSESMMVMIDDVKNRTKFDQLLGSFVSELDGVRRSVADSLPTVKALAKKNLQPSPAET
ncbi:polysaccharide pyruvyl transferase family protein [Methylibium sp.]|uniref:polysaccharide pyruvyl transferase family protein n=1 Tax=Methylibium sp. TaxID=2067992 RepID=UPI003D14BC1F